MNKGFGIIWNPVRGAYMVTAETAKAHGKKNARNISLKKSVSILSLAICMSSVWAGKPPVFPVETSQERDLREWNEQQHKQEVAASTEAMAHSTNHALLSPEVKKAQHTAEATAAAHAKAIAEQKKAEDAAMARIIKDAEDAAADAKEKSVAEREAREAAVEAKVQAKVKTVAETKAIQEAKKAAEKAEAKLAADNKAVEEAAIARKAAELKTAAEIRAMRDAALAKASNEVKSALHSKAKREARKAQRAAEEKVAAEKHAIEEAAKAKTFAEIKAAAEIKATQEAANIQELHDTKAFNNALEAKTRAIKEAADAKATADIKAAIKEKKSKEAALAKTVAEERNAVAENAAKSAEEAKIDAEAKFTLEAKAIREAKIARTVAQEKTLAERKIAKTAAQAHATAQDKFFAETKAIDEAAEARAVADITADIQEKNAKLAADAHAMAAATAADVASTVPAGHLAAAKDIATSNKLLPDSEPIPSDTEPSILVFEGPHSYFPSGLTGAQDVYIFNNAYTTLPKDNNSAAFSGHTVVAGTLVVNGKLGGTVIILPTGRLQGSGNIENVIVETGGVFAPGNSIGTPHVQDFLVLGKGAILEVEIAPNGSSDHVQAGNIDLQNAKLAVVGNGSRDYKVGTRYTILTAGEAITGNFTSMTQKGLPFITLLLDQDNQHIYLDIVRNNATFTELATSSNQVAIARMLSANDKNGSAGGNGPPDNLGALILTLSTPLAVQQAFNVLSGEIYASSQHFLLNDSHHVRDAAIDRLRANVNQPNTNQANTEQSRVWGQGYGAWGRYNASSAIAKMDYRQSGVLLGTESMNGAWRTGVLGGYGQSRLDISDQHNRSTIDSYHVGLYAGTTQDTWNIRFGSAYSWNKAKATRNFAINAQSFSNEGDYRAHTWQFFGEVGYQLTAGSVAIEPLVNVAHVRVKNNAFQETGSSASALQADSQHNRLTFSTAGLRIAHALTAKQSDIALQAELGWRHAYGDLNPGMRIGFANTNSSELIGGSPIAKDMAVIGAGVGVKIGKSANFEMNYVGNIAKGMQENGVQANIVWKF